MRAYQTDNAGIERISVSDDLARDRPLNLSTSLRRAGVAKSTFFQFLLRLISSHFLAMAYTGPLGDTSCRSFAGSLGQGFGGSACGRQACFSQQQCCTL